MPLAVNHIESITIPIVAVQPEHRPVEQLEASGDYHGRT
jgi:hypothetical protein